VTIVVQSEQEWGAFCDIAHIEGLAEDPRFADMAARREHQRELDEQIGAWTAIRDAYWVMERLQQAGIAAGVVMHERDAVESRQLEARGFWQTLTHPEAGTHRNSGPLWRTQDGPVPLRRAAPRLGEDNEYVYRELLGFSDEDYRQYEDDGHIGMDYDPSL
jgi:crotonobetainyl-CoA:carnitine CoA-transferase CaiB-like acyl-CoA transferase